MHTSTHHSHKGSRKAQEIATRGMVMNLGWRYDLIVWFVDTLLLQGKLRDLRQRTIDLAQLRPGEALLDAGCGTGSLAIESYKLVGTTGRVCGIDPGPKQIARANAKAARASLPIDFQVGAIERLPFSDHSFDVATCTVMMHHLPDDLKRLGLVEMARVLKPGGRLVIADFKRPERQDQSKKFGAGSFGLQDLPRLLEEAGFSQIEGGDIPLPRLMGLEGAGFVRARMSS